MCIILSSLRKKSSSDLKEVLGCSSFCSYARAHTCAVAPIRSQGKARFADALETSIFVDAHSIQTHVGGGTFIMI